MRGFISTLLIFVMLMQIFSTTIIYTSFKVNQDYISKNLCENRSKPGKHCCGKCQLKKRLKSEEQNQNSGLPTSSKNFDEVVYMNEELASGNLISHFTSELLFQNFAQETFSGMREDIFHPPSFI